MSRLIGALKGVILKVVVIIGNAILTNLNFVMKFFVLWCKTKCKAIVLTMILVININAGLGLAASELHCTTEKSRIGGVTFTPVSLEFHDDNAVNYLAGNVIIVDSRAFSATFRSQIIEQLNWVMAEFSNFQGQFVNTISDKPDRYGRLVVDLFGGSDQKWLQGELVDRGLVMVRPEGGNLECIKMLLAAEADARKNKTGIWQIPGIIMASDAENWQNRVQSYQLVEGIIVSVGKTKSKTYLNFGDNWNKDFTVIVAKRNFKRFKNIYGDFKRFTGKKVRIRGWMTQNRGPMIEIYHPGQIEFDIE